MTLSSFCNFVKALCDAICESPLMDCYSMLPYAAFLTLQTSTRFITYMCPSRKTNNQKKRMVSKRENSLFVDTVV